jgi:hypothetical protein
MKIASAAPAPGVKLPRRVTIDLAGRDASSGVAAAEAMLNAVAPPLEAKAPMSIGDAPSGAGGRSNRDRRLLAEAAPAPQRLGGAYVHGTNEPVVLGAWLRSDEPGRITLENLPSGAYTLQARGVDAAGNVGPPTEPMRFDVDASLMLPEEAAALREQRLRLGFGLGIGLGGAALLAAAVAAAYHWRKGSVARRVARERDAAARRQQFEQWAAYDAAARAAAGHPVPGAGGGGGSPYAGQQWPDQRLVSNGTPGWAALGWAAPSAGAAAGAGAAAATPRGRAAEIDQGLLDMLAQRDAEEARAKAAAAAASEEEQLRKAIAASLQEQRGGGSGSSSVDATVDVAIGAHGAAAGAPQRQLSASRGWRWLGGGK